MNASVPLIVTGANGRIGRLLQLHRQRFEAEGFSPIWVTRKGRDTGPTWDMVAGPLPVLPIRGFLLHLAAVLPSRPLGGDLAGNIAMARAVLNADQKARFAHVFFLSTVAVYAPQAGRIAESVAPDPQSDYGRCKFAAERVLHAGLGDRLTVLRLANLAGADALLGSGGAVLDPVEGSEDGPVRSYIGPLGLVEVLARLLGLRAGGQVLPEVLNLAQPGAVSMADLLRAAGRDWHFGLPRPGVVARVEVDVSRLGGLVPLPRARAADIVAELNAVRGRWP